MKEIYTRTDALTDCQTDSDSIYTYRRARYCAACACAVVRAMPADAQWDWLEYEDSDELPQPMRAPRSDRRVYCSSCGEYLYGGDSPSKVRAVVAMIRDGDPDMRRDAMMAMTTLPERLND